MLKLFNFMEFDFFVKAFLFLNIFDIKLAECYFKSKKDPKVTSQQKFPSNISTKGSFGNTDFKNAQQTIIRL